MASRVLILIVLLAVGYVYSFSVQPLSCKQIRAFVDGHNSRRLELAKGKVSGQPPASQMKYMVWDDELAAKAASWANTNNDGHNPSRSLGSHRFNVGENIYWYSTTDSRYVFNPDQALSSWFGEHKNYKFAPLRSSDFRRSQDNQIGHYTQMVWSDTVYVGCAISKEVTGNWYKYKVVCNYGPSGNYIGRTPYKTNGKAVRGLTCSLEDCSQPYGDRC